MKRKWTILFLCVMLLTGCSNLTDTTSDNRVQTTADTASDPSPESSSNDSSSLKKQKSSAKKASGNSNKLSVHFIDVGQGDSELITIGSHAMLIDAGDNSKGTAVQLYLQKQGISSLDYVIGTHPDSDHIGGLDVILYKFDCKKILMPDCSNNTATYRDVLDSMKAKNYKAIHPKAGTSYSLGDASFTITGPVRNYKETNDNSISLRLTYQDTSFLFMGDTTSDAEQDILSHSQKLSADVLKVAHHGSKYSTSEAFFARVNPSWAVISCAEENHYGFPSARVLNLLRSAGTKVFRTDEQGSIIATSDGNSIQWNASPSTSWKAGENTQSSAQGSSDSSSSDSAAPKKQSSSRQNSTEPSNRKNITFLLNTSTKKFHKTTCRYTNQMSAKNTEYTEKNRDTLIEQGYTPCKYCNP